MDFTSNRDLWLRPDGHGDMRDVRIEEGALRGRSIGPGPLLLGPPRWIWRRAHRCHRDQDSATAGRQARLLWINQPGQEWSAERSATLDLQADGRMDEYEFSLRDHPRWSARSPNSGLSRR
jgi:hypothetical protein